MSKQAIKFRVGYNWSGNYGLSALVVGAVRYAADHPTLPAYARPTEPGNNPALPGNASGLQIRIADGNHERRQKDWARVCGFVRGMGENVQDALDKPYWSGLDDQEYGFLNVWPEDYTSHLTTRFCPLDSQAVDEVKEEFKRGWDHANGELIGKFGDRLDQEQTAFTRDGVTISNEEKYRHYIKEMYRSGQFTQDMVMEWIAKPPADPTHANARTFFERKILNMENAARLTGNTAATHGFGTAAVAGELGEIKEALMGAIREAVADAVAEERSETTSEENKENANAMTQIRSENKSLRDEMSEMTRTILVLSNQVATLKNAIPSGKLNIPSDQNDDSNNGDGGGTGGGRRGGKRNGGPQKRKQPHPVFGEYKSGMKLDETWPWQKQRWWCDHAQFDDKNKSARRAFEKKRLQAQLAKLDE